MSTAFRAECACGDDSGVLPSKAAARQWAADHNTVHESRGGRRVITIQEVVK